MIYEYWLAGIKEITDLKKQKLREVYGSGKAIYYIEETKLDKLRFLNEKDVAILKNAKKDTELEEKWRRTEEKKNTVYSVLFKDVSGKTEIYYRSSVCIICTRTTSG